MIIGITMQHPTGVALAPIEHGGEQTSTIETGESAKESNDIPILEEPRSSYQFHEEMHTAIQPTTMVHTTGMNGVVPPTHVYVSDQVALQQQQLHQHHIMGQLEAQFAHFGVQEHHIHSEHLDSSGNNSNSDNNAEDVEGEETDDEPLKLFVGQVGKLCRTLLTRFRVQRNTMSVVINL
jgi:hypothetical protein